MKPLKYEILSLYFSALWANFFLLDLWFLDGYSIGNLQITQLLQFFFIFISFGSVLFLLWSLVIRFRRKIWNPFVFLTVFSALPSLILLIVGGYQLITGNSI